MGGTELAMYHYAQALVQAGHDVTVFTTNAINFQSAGLPPHEIRDGIRIVRFATVPFPMKYAFISLGLARALLRINVQILQVFSLLPSFFILASILIAKVRAVPLVLYPQFHPNRFDQHPERWTRILGGVFDRGVAVHFVRMADYVICLTRLEERLYRRSGIKNLKTIYEWIPRRHAPTEEAVERFRKKFGLGENEKIVLFVGRVDKRKGLDILLRALPRVIENMPNVKLLVVGKDWGYLRECLRIAQELRCLKHVTATGPVDEEEIEAAYCIADVVVIPSSFEAYGRTLIEAWTFRKPVVLTDRVALSELVTANSGVVVRSGSASELSGAILRILSDETLAERLGNNGHASLCANMLETHQIVDQLVSIYRVVRRGSNRRLSGRSPH